MKLTGRTVLITGGTSGIGFELARQLLALGNRVIVTGRDRSKLEEAMRKLDGVHCIQADVSRSEDIKSLFSQVIQEFPDLDVLVNNAGIMRKVSLHNESHGLEDITREIDINLSGLIWMTKQFLPHLKLKPSAVIINVSSGLAFVPFPISPIYSATKAGVHAFTECLRIQLKNTKVQVVELAPPGTETPLLRGDFDGKDLDGVKGMEVQKMVAITLKELAKDALEIRPGLANVLKIMSRIAPKFILKQLAKPVDLMLQG